MTTWSVSVAPLGLVSAVAWVVLSGCTSESDASTDGAGGSSSSGTTVAATTSGAGANASSSGAGTSTSSGPVTPDCNDAPSPAPSPAWENVTSNLAGLPSECGNLTLVVATPCSTQVIAGVAQKGLWQTNDGGATWTPLGTGPGSDVVTNRPSSIVHDPVHADVFWTSGIYNGKGVYRTGDLGVTLQSLGDIGHIDLVSVDLSDPARNTLLAGGHEQKRTLYRSTNGGLDWTNVGLNLPQDSHFSSFPLVIDATTHLVGACGWGDGTCGIWRTVDGGATWLKASDLPVQGAPLWASDGTIYYPLNDSTLARSTDGGQSFTHLSTGLAVVTPAELPDGRIASFQNGKIALSKDHGETWSPIGETLPFGPAGLTYSAETRSFFVWHWDCGDVVLSDAIARSGFDYLSQ